jgi:hypothetical protein
VNPWPANSDSATMVEMPNTGRPESANEASNEIFTGTDSELPTGPVATSSAAAPCSRASAALRRSGMCGAKREAGSSPSGEKRNTRTTLSLTSSPA